MSRSSGARAASGGDGGTADAVTRERARRMIRAAEINGRYEAIAAFNLLEDLAMSWQPACPPVRAEGGDAFVHLPTAARKPELWTLPKQLPNVDVLRDMARAMEQMHSHFDQGKLEGKRWSLRHTHALWGIFFPGTPPPQKLKDRQMYELDADVSTGEIEAVIVVAMCMLFNDDLTNTAGDAQPQAARNLAAIAGGVNLPVGVGAVDEALESGRPLLIVTNLRAGRCVQREDGCGCMGISGREAPVAREIHRIFELHVELRGISVLATVAACADAARELDVDCVMPHLSALTTARATTAPNAATNLVRAIEALSTATGLELDELDMEAMYDQTVHLLDGGCTCFPPFSKYDEELRAFAGADGQDFSRQQAALARYGWRVHERHFGKDSELGRMGLSLSWSQATSRCLRDEADRRGYSRLRWYRGRQRRVRQLLANARALKAGGKALKERVVAWTKEHNGAHGGKAARRLVELARLRAIEGPNATQSERIDELSKREADDIASVAETNRLKSAHNGAQGGMAAVRLAELARLRAIEGPNATQSERIDELSVSEADDIASVAETKRLQSEHNGAHGGMAAVRLAELARLRAIEGPNATQSERIDELSKREADDIASVAAIRQKRVDAGMGRDHEEWVRLAEEYLNASDDQREVFGFSYSLLNRLVSYFTGSDCDLRREVQSAAEADAAAKASAAPEADAAPRSSTRKRRKSAKQEQEEEEASIAAVASSRSRPMPRKGTMQQALIAAEKSRRSGQLPDRNYCVDRHCLFGNQVKEGIPGLIHVQCDGCNNWQHACCVGIRQPEEMEYYECPVCLAATPKTNATPKPAAAAPAPSAPEACPEPARAAASRSSRRTRGAAPEEEAAPRPRDAEPAQPKPAAARKPKAASTTVKGGAAAAAPAVGSGGASQTRAQRRLPPTPVAEAETVVQAGGMVGGAEPEPEPEAAGVEAEVNGAAGGEAGGEAAEVAGGEAAAPLATTVATGEAATADPPPAAERGRRGSGARWSPPEPTPQIKPAERTRTRRKEAAALAAQQREQNDADLAELDAAAEEASQHSVSKEKAAETLAAAAVAPSATGPARRAPRTPAAALQTFSRRSGSSRSAAAAAAKAEAEAEAEGAAEVEAQAEAQAEVDPCAFFDEDDGGGTPAAARAPPASAPEPTAVRELEQPSVPKPKRLRFSLGEHAAHTSGADDAVLSDMTAHRGQLAGGQVATGGRAASTTPSPPPALTTSPPAATPLARPKAVASSRSAAATRDGAEAAASAGYHPKTDAAPGAHKRLSAQPPSGQPTPARQRGASAAAPPQLQRQPASTSSTGKRARKPAAVVCLSGFSDQDTARWSKLLEAKGGAVETGGSGGGSMARISACSHLVVQRPLKRTGKLLAAMSLPSCALVHEEWLVAVETAGKFVDVTPYLLHGAMASDPKAAPEMKWSFDATVSRERALAGPCFAGRSFYVTKSTKPSPKDLAIIIGNAGGAVVGGSGALPAGTVVISCEQDRRDFSKARFSGLPVLRVEHLLTCVLRQELQTGEGRLA